MSFDIFLSRFQDGEKATIPRKIVEKAFEALADQSDPTWWKLKDSGAVIIISDQSEIGGFTVNRPPGKHPFWDALLDVMRQTSTVLYWPGGGAVVADALVIPHLPPYVIRDQGVPEVVSAGHEILECIEKS